MHGPRLLLGARAALALAGLALLGGCDSATDPQRLGGLPPEVDSLAFSPDSVFFDEVLVGGDSAGIDLSISVRAADPDGPVGRVQYAVNWQYGETVARGPLEEAGGGRYAAEVPLRLRRDQRGRYTVLVYAVDGDGLLSNQASGTFLLTGTNLGPPVIGEVSAPEEYRPSPSGTLRIVAAVSDPDGPRDVARVEGAFPVGGTFRLRDDGSPGSGDADDGDGRYTVFFGIDAATPGPLPVRLWAVDRDGAVSDTTRFTIRIVE